MALCLDVNLFNEGVKFKIHLKGISSIVSKYLVLLIYNFWKFTLSKSMFEVKKS